MPVYSASPLQCLGVHHSTLSQKTQASTPTSDVLPRSPCGTCMPRSAVISHVHHQVGKSPDGRHIPTKSSAVPLEPRVVPLSPGWSTDCTLLSTGYWPVAIDCIMARHPVSRRITLRHGVSYCIMWFPGVTMCITFVRRLLLLVANAGGP